MEMHKVIELVRSHAKSPLVGYQDWEIPKIEKLYDIKVDREFKEFLLAMGRCSGGAIGGRSVILYRSHLFIRSYIGIQSVLWEELHRLQQFEIMKLNPFVFAIEAETHYLFLKTKEAGKQFVYEFDENSDQIKKTRESLSDYMYRQASIGIKYEDYNTIESGDLLSI
ncbi:MAG: SMI1/KNR4 family protein [Spirulinaceae cyanobacterium]